MYYDNIGHIHINHPRWTNTMDKNPRVPNHEFFYKVSSNSKGFHFKISPKQEKLSWIMYLVGKFTNLGELVLGFFEGTCVDSEACIFLSKHILSLAAIWTRLFLTALNELFMKSTLASY